MQWPNPYSDVVLAKNPTASAATWSFQPPNNPYPIEQQGYIGCGNGRSNDTQLLDNISFMWMGITSGSAVPNYALVNGSDAFNGVRYQYVEFTSGNGRVGLANYGLDCQLGLFLVGGNEYVGHIWVRTNVSTTFLVSVEDWTANDVLDSVAISADTNGQWQRFNFTLVPSKNTSCGATNATTQGYASTIYSCSGRFVVSLTEPGTSLDVDLVYLSPGSWGTVPAPTAGSIGLPARLDVANELAGEYIKTIRMVGFLNLTTFTRSG